MRKTLNNFYKNTFSGWSPEKQSKFVDSVNDCNLKKYKHVVASLILTDNSPWEVTELEYFVLQLRTLSRRIGFTYYLVSLVYHNENKEIYYKRFGEYLDIDLRIEELEDNISKLKRELDKSSNEAKKVIQNTTINLITILGIFAAIISFVIITAGTVIKSEFAIPIMLIFAAILFSFVLLLKFLSIYGDKWWHWMIISVIVVFLMWAGFRTFANQPVIPFIK